MSLHRSGARLGGVALHPSLFLLVAATLCACGIGDLEIALLPLPGQSEGARSLLVAAQEHGQIVSLDAIDLEAPSPFWRLPFLVEADVLIEALVYEDDLATLSLVPGPVEQGPPTSRRRLPSEFARYWVTVTAAGPVPDGWVPRDERSAELDAVRLPDDGSYCPRVRVTNYSLPSPDNGAFAGRLPSGQVLLGDAAGNIWTTDGPLSNGLARNEGDTFALTSFSVAPDTEELYFGAPHGEIHRGRIGGPELRTERVAKAPTEQSLRFLEVVSSSTSLELYTMSLLGQVFHYAEPNWTLLYDFERPGGFARLQGLVRLEDEHGTEVLAVAAEDNRVVSIRNGIVELQDVGSAAGLVEIATVDWLGPVVGNAEGEIFARIDGSWQALGPTEVAVWLTVIDSVEPGLLVYLGAFGNLGLLRNGASCGATQLLPGDPFWLVPVGPVSERRFIGYGDTPANAGLWYTEVRLE